MTKGETYVRSAFSGLTRPTVGSVASGWFRSLFLGSQLGFELSFDSRGRYALCPFAIPRTWDRAKYGNGDRGDVADGPASRRTECGVV